MQILNFIVYCSYCYLNDAVEIASQFNVKVEDHLQGVHLVVPRPRAHCLASVSREINMLEILIVLLIESVNIQK